MKFMRFSHAAVLSVAIAGIAVMYGGCNKPYLPWVQSPWPPAGERGYGRPADKPSIEREPQEPAEDFCKDMEESIEQYRSYVEDETLSERRRRNIRNLVEQYDRICVENQQ